jgi:hypothetical protein
LKTKANVNDEFKRIRNVGCFVLHSFAFLVYSTLMMEIAGPSGILFDFQRTGQRYNPEERSLDKECSLRYCDVLPESQNVGAD